MTGLLDKLREIFAERQIYVRKNGSVTFVPLSSRSLVVLTLLFTSLLRAGSAMPPCMSYLITGWVPSANKKSVK